MKVRRIEDAVPYDAPGHFRMQARRLQGGQASPATSCSVALSVFEIGGGAEQSATAFEKIYVVLSGEITVTTETDEVTLKKYDSCLIEPGETRAISNHGQEPAELLVITPAT